MDEYHEENASTPYKRMVDWLNKHKGKAVALLFVAVTLAIAAIISILILQELRTTESFTESPGMWEDSVSKGHDYEQMSPTSDAGTSDDTVGINDIPGIKVIEAGAEIVSKDAKDDELRVRSMVESYGGYVERSELIERVRSINVRMTLRIPSESFDQFFDSLRESTEVESYRVSDYRIELERRETQLDTVRETIAMYNDMIEESREMELDNTRINLTKSLTDAKMNLVRRENDIVDSLQQSRRKSEYSTVGINIKESISPKIWPESVGESFRENLQRSLNKAVNTVTSAVGDLLNIFVTVVVWMLYILVALIPVWITYRLLRRLYFKLYRSNREQHQD